jgi:predicted metal-binding protein
MAISKMLDRYLKKAKKMGAVHAIAVRASDVVVDPRVLLKCMYGCPTWNRNWTCPSTPKALRPWEFAEILKRYKTGMLIHTHDKKLSQDISFEIERDAFLDGHYLAFSMSDCTMCKECAYPNKNCRFPKKARPAMQGLGIDVYATVRKFGLPLKPLKDHSEPQNWYSLVLLE